MTRMHPSSQKTDWLTLHQVAMRLQVKESHLRALVRRQQIPVCRVGRLLRFEWPAIEQWLRDDEHGSVSSESCG